MSEIKTARDYMREIEALRAKPDVHADAIKTLRTDLTAEVDDLTALTERAGGDSERLAIAFRTLQLISGEERAWRI